MYGDERTQLHESAHAVVAKVLGRRVGLVTVMPGETRSGCCWWKGTRPKSKPGGADSLLAWPASWLRVVAGDVAIALAGDMGEVMFMPPSEGRAALTLADQVRDELAVVTLPEPTGAELEQAARGANAEGKSDGEMVADLLRFACVADPWRTAALLGFVEAETACLLRQHEIDVRRVARLLGANGTLGAEACRKALRGVR